jgi:hypothetical protein
MLEITIHLKDKQIEKIAENIATSGEVCACYTTESITEGLKEFLRNSSTFYDNLINSFDSAIDWEELLDYCEEDWSNIP